MKNNVIKFNSYNPSYQHYTDKSTIAQHRISNFKKTNWDNVDSRFALSKKQAFELMVVQLIDFVDGQTLDHLMLRNGLKTQFYRVKKQFEVAS